MTSVSLVAVVFSVRASLDWGVYGSFLLLRMGWVGNIPLQEVV
jgi:hypothetical protein